MGLLVGRQLESSIRKVKAGDMTGLSEIYDIAGKKMYALAYSVLGDYQLAEDCVQESFIKIMRSAGSMQKEDKANSWIMMIVKNTSLDILRSRSRETAVDDIISVVDSVKSTSFSEDSIAVDEAMKMLNETERQIVLLKVSAGLKYKEIAPMFNLTAEACRKVYSRSIDKLRQYLA